MGQPPSPSLHSFTAHLFQLESGVHFDKLGSKGEVFWSTRNLHCILWGNSILLATVWLDFTLGCDIRKNFMGGQSQNFSLCSHDSTNRLTVTQQRLSTLPDSVYKYSEAKIGPCSLFFHPVYPLGSRPWSVSHPVLFAPLPSIGKQIVSHLCHQTFIRPRSQGWDKVQLAWARPFNMFKCPQPTPPTWDGSWALRRVWKTLVENLL